MQTTGESLGTKQSRARRSRAGCWTCKRLHRKCDERKPQCGPCSRSRSPCEGYGLRLVWKQPKHTADKTSGSELTISDTTGSFSIRDRRGSRHYTPAHGVYTFTVSPDPSTDLVQNSSISDDFSSTNESISTDRLNPTLVCTGSSSVEDEVQKALLNECKLRGNISQPPFMVWSLLGPYIYLFRLVLIMKE